MVRTWAERGWDIDVVTEFPVYPMGKRSTKSSVKQADKKLPSQVRVHRLATNEYDPASFLQKLWNQILFLLAALRYVLEHPKQYDLVYVSSPPIFPAFAGVLIKYLMGTRLTLELRDVWPDAIAPHSPLNHSPISYKVLKQLEQLLYDHADRLVTVTPESTEMIRPLSNGTPVSMIRNGIDDRTFKPNPYSNPTSKNKFVVGYVGSFASQHDIQTLLKAASLCQDDPEISFHIIGSGKREYEFRSLLKTFELTNVHWIGLVPHTDIPNYISEFDVAVNPILESAATRSSVTVKFYEYLACGIPIINSACGAADALGHATGSVYSIPASNPMALANAIRELKQHPEQLTQMQEAACAYFREHGKEFSRSHQANRLADILNAEII